ncbi:MAG: HAD family hydrolase [Planctomycetota bacterium]|nr:HAD family hydrolase [Planctomycetota bacterium]
MGKTLAEYAAWLDERELIWPTPPAPVPAKATPYLKPLPEVRAVLWNVYGTLLTISDGQLLHLVDDPLRMEVALDKTVQEFNMWNSMYRKPGAPWELMFQQYKPLVEDFRLTAKVRKGEHPEVDSAAVWKKLVERLLEKKHSWDQSIYGGLDDYAAKIAFFYHSALQGVAATPHAREALHESNEAGLLQGIVGEGQCFTLTQASRVLDPGRSTLLSRCLTSGCVSLSSELGVQPPSERLFQPCLDVLREFGVGSGEILYVSSRLAEDLAPAKQLGMRTALYAGDKNSLRATGTQVRDPELKPDRILTDLAQIRQIAGLG